MENPPVGGSGWVWDKGLEGGRGIGRAAVLDDEAAVLEDVPDGIDAQVVGEMLVAGHVAQDEIHPLAGLEAADLARGARGRRPRSRWRR